MSNHPAGYEAIIQRYRLEVIPNPHRSWVQVAGQTHHRSEENGIVREIYPARYRPGDGLGEQLEFALKYDGVNLAILAQIFAVADVAELLAYLRSKPTGKYARRIWFLYEFLTGEILPLENLKQGNYVDLLETDRYFTLAKGTPVRRQRIRNNLPGTRAFCPIVRRTETLQQMEADDLAQACKNILVGYPPDLLRRALAYLYTKETKSSFFIEHEEPGSTRIERFAVLLHEAQQEDFCHPERLLELQNRIVDKRFADTGYRRTQNYVGETVSLGQEKIHYVSPRPEDIDDLMGGLIACHRRMRAGGMHPLIHAAVIAYGFVFLHPFEDGNGRIHRFLIHNILALQGFTPQGIMFPVSAAMLKDPTAYDRSLEAFSAQLMPHIAYMLDEEGIMTVSSETAHWYQYMDLTAQSEALYRFVHETIDTELPEELLFLAGYDRAKNAIKEIVDMPDRLIDLFIRFVRQNHGKLSIKKREQFFDNLTSDEIREIEDAVSSSLKP